MFQRKDVESQLINAPNDPAKPRLWWFLGVDIPLLLIGKSVEPLVSFLPRDITVKYGYEYRKHRISVVITYLAKFFSHFVNIITSIYYLLYIIRSIDI